MNKYANLFVAGDWVYCPHFKGGKLYKLELCHDKNTPVSLRTEGGHLYSFSSEGHLRTDDKIPYFHHATPENYAALKVLYPEITFQEPPKRGSELTKELLKLGKPVWCWISNTSDGHALEKAVLAQITKCHAGFFYHQGGNSVYAVPVPRSVLLMEKYSFPDDYDPSLVIEVNDE